MVIHGCWQIIQIIVLAQIYFLQEDLKMNIGVTEISPREVQRKAEKCFKEDITAVKLWSARSAMNSNWMCRKRL